MVTCPLCTEAELEAFPKEYDPEPLNSMYIFVGSHSGSVLIAFVDDRS